MLVFCEECGEQYQVDSNAGISHLQCHRCAETLRISTSAGLGGQRRQTPLAVRAAMETAAPEQPFKVLIVDDSKVIRKALCKLFDGNPAIKVIGEATNGAEALHLVDKLNPDVVTLDINMPVMDGLTTVKYLMIKSPKPILMFSTLTSEGASETFDALRYGAIDFMLKPSHAAGQSLEEQRVRIIEKVIMAARVKIDAIRFLRGSSQKKQENGKSTNCKYLFALGASEGCYGALLNIMPQLKSNLPAAFLVVLYADEPNIETFASYLDKHSAVAVKRAKDGDLIEAGACYIASAGEYLSIEQSEKKQLRIQPAPHPGRKGGINRLMFSVADSMKERAVGVILTGSGEDGVEGLGEILRVGGTAIVQDPENCLCKETSYCALKRHEIDLVLSAQTMAIKINDLLTPLYGEGEP
jgi:two-component system chemotaxis response regulator CheB